MNNDKPIKEIAHIVSQESRLFTDKICEAVGTFEDAGLRVEIQYQQTGKSYSALVIGRQFV